MKRYIKLLMVLMLLLSGSVLAQDGALAPDGTPHETYFAAFPLTITLDGDLSDWENVPKVTIPDDAEVGGPAVTFAAVADDQYLYFLGDVADDNIISGQHETDYWNEDSIEFYINATGDLTLTSYQPGVAQVTIPALNASLTPDVAVLAGVQGDTAQAQVNVVLTDTGYAVEMAVPLTTDVWQIVPSHGAEIGFQVHLNAASELNRDTKLIWSAFDTSDRSYQDPSVFGTLIFYEIGRTDLPGAPLVLANSAEMFESEFIAWGDTADNVVLTAVDVAPESEMALPDQTDPVTVLQATYSIASWGGFSHDMTTNRDWSAYDALQFWMYGTNTGATVQVEIHDDPNSDVEGDSAERFYYRITDDFEGWKQFTIPFGSFVRRTDWQPAGAMDDGLTLTNVAGYSFGLPTGTEEQTLYFAQIEVVQGDFAAEPEVTVEPTATPEPVIETAPLNAPYRNPNLPVEDRVNDLLSRMTLDEKIGQVTLVDKNSINPDDITLLSIGGLLSGGGGYPDTENTPEAWAEMVDGFQMYALQSRLGIPVIYGVDAVHGHNNVRGAVIFPHNIGMGATGDPDLVEQVCHATAEEMIATGIYWDYAPVVAVPQDIRWGRLYEGYSENTDLVTQLATACVSGLQGENLGDPGSVLATPKHYVGDGGAVWGTSTTNDYQIDQGVTDVDEATLRAIHLPPYVAVIDNGAMNIMISFSSWGGIKMHGQDYLINDVMKGELGFTGFTVSDWAGIDQLPGDYYSDVVTSINAGVDMVMVPYDYLLFIQTLRQAVDNGDISEERIDDAVRRILRVKFELGLFEWGFSDPRMLETVGSEAHRALARQAVAESAVLLQNNDQTLPLAKDTPTIFVAGQAADDIGMQSGGWTIEWQGNTGEITDGATILDGIEAAVSGDVYYDEAGEFADATDASGNPLTADVGIVVVGEIPYAEGIGDRADLTLSAEDQALIEQVRARSSKLVIVLVSGRPLVVTDQLRLSDAFVAAWLPGTEGQGVADVLFGDMPFTGKLSYTWPRSNEQLPFDFANLSTEGCDAPLFPFGYGLDTTTTQTLVIEDCP